LKQVELAKICNIHESMVSLILKGERRPSWDVAKKLAKATGTDPYLWMEYKISEMLKAVKDAG
jgi:plasmid maintenance system antidote protein VapI